uniref:Uncharacterized protein n=1 Tax=Spongospora subterranea TaxID=70186 RepID=A0A0H5QJH4_9EUKA|eukprot:CRZ02265.1 hypothetical protein [Spongospora subterranea]
MVDDRTPRRLLGEQLACLGQLNDQILSSLDENALFDIGAQLANGVNEREFVECMLTVLRRRCHLSGSYSRSVGHYALGLVIMFRSMDLNGNGDLDFSTPLRF